MSVGHHLDANSKRAALLGAMDGVVSNLGIVLAFTTASLVVTGDVFKAGLIGMLTGAISMGCNEYASVKVQEEIVESCGDDEHEVNAWKAGVLSFLAFSGGAFIVVFPLLLNIHIFFSIAASSVALGLAGAILAPRHKLKHALRLVVIAAIATAAGLLGGFFINFF